MATVGLSTVREPASNLSSKATGACRYFAVATRRTAPCVSGAVARLVPGHQWALCVFFTKTELSKIELFFMGDLL
jgi:hypothetical protein